MQDGAGGGGGVGGGGGDGAGGHLMVERLHLHSKLGALLCV